MARKGASARLELRLGPSPLLASLHALHEAAAEAGPAEVGSTLARGLDKTLRRSDRALARVRTLLEWLMHQELCSQPGQRAARKGAPRTVRWAAPSLVRADVARVAHKASKEGERTGPWHVTLAALRSLLGALGEMPWLRVLELRWNGRTKELAEVRARLGEFTAALRAQAEEAEEPEEEPARVAAERPRARAAEAPREERAKREEPAKAKAKPRREKGPVRGFGGLPEDAEPAAGATPAAQRGMTEEARFFLREAGLEERWPCEREALETARRRVLARLHPDRHAGASTADFQRAAEGARQLVAALEAAGVGTPPVAASAPEAKPARPQVVPAEKSGEERAEKSAEKKPERREKVRGKSAARGAPGGAWVAGAQGQWPPPAAATG